MNKQPRERGQQIVLFGVLLAAVVAVGAALATNLVWLRAEWTALQEAAISAASAGTTEILSVPGDRRLDLHQAEGATRTLLRDNLAALPFLADDASTIAGTADCYAGNPASGECLADPLGGPCHEAPFVSLRAQVPIYLPWGGWRITLPIRAVAETGTSPQ